MSEKKKLGAGAKRYIHIAIMLAITLGIGFLCPTFGQVTRFGMQVLGVFVGVLYGWIAFDLIFSSIYGYVMLAVMGIMPAADALSVGFGNSNLVVVLVAMVFNGALDACGVTGAIANFLVTRKIFRKKPWLLVIGLIASAYIMGLLGVHLAACFLLWAVVVKISDENNIPKGDSFITYMILMICAAAFAGIFSLPFRATSMIFESYFINTMQMQFDTAAFVVVAVSFSVCVLTLMILLGKFVFRLDASKFVMNDNVVEQYANATVNSKQKIGIITLIAYMLILLLPSFFSNMPGAAFISSLGVGGMSCVGLLVLAAISIKDEPVVSLAKTWTKSIDWTLILLLSVTFPIAEVMRSGDAGIMATVVAFMKPVVSTLGINGFMIVSMLLLGILTQVTHNIVLAAMFTPFLCPLIQQMGGNPYVMWFLMYFSLNASFVTPAASFQSAMVHGHERVSSKWCYITGTAYSVVTWIILILVTIPLANALC
jgi:sodium-dependent dicarboxylate transporter 2/3/5